MAMKPGLINIVGIDGSGKTSVCSLLHSKLNEVGIRNCVIEANPFNFMEYVEFRNFIKVLKDNRIKLPQRYFTAILISESVERLKKIFNEINCYDFVICDRYIEKVLEFLDMRNLDYKHVKVLLDSIPIPEYVFLIDVPVDVAINRIMSRDSDMRHHQHLDFYSLRNKYLEWARLYNYIILDGTHSSEAIATEIIKIIR